MGAAATISLPRTSRPGWPRSGRRALGGVGISYALAVAGATLAVLVIYLVYRHAARLLDRLGEVGMLVLMRIMAFVLLCIGIEIIWTGWAELQLQAR